MTLDEEETLKNLIQETDIFVCVKDKNKKKQNKTNESHSVKECICILLESLEF